MGLFADAEVLLVSSYERLERAQGESGVETSTTRERLIGLYEGWGKPEKAAKYQAPPAKPMGSNVNQVLLPE